CARSGQALSCRCDAFTLSVSASMRGMNYRLAFVLLVACSSNSGGNNQHMDAPVPPSEAFVYKDAPPSVPAMIKVSGVAGEGGSGGGNTPKQGAAVSVLKSADDSVLGMATTDAMGKYSISI